MNQIIAQFAADVQAGPNVAIFGSALPDGAEGLGDVAVRRHMVEALGPHAFRPLLADHAAKVAAGSATGVVGSSGRIAAGTRGTVPLRITTLLHAGGNSTLIY